MKNIKINVLFLATILFFTACESDKKNTESKRENHIWLTINTAEEAILELKKGNERFIENKFINTDYKSQIENTKTDQHPHTLILSCLDSRVPPEIIFDQGIGNIFVARNAGNIEDQNILGSMEFATKLKGTKLIVVMGHAHCGAVKGAIENVELGYLTQLVEQIKPAIINNKNKDMMIEETAKNNVRMTISDILNKSVVINQLVKENKVKIVGAYYDLENGKVTFID